MSENVATNASEFVAVPFGETCWRQLMPEFEPDTTEAQAQSMLAGYDAVRVAAFNDYIYVIGHRPPSASPGNLTVGQWSQPPSVSTAPKSAQANVRSGRRQSTTNLPSLPPLLNNVMRFCLRTLTWSKQPIAGDAPPVRLANYAFCYDAPSGKAYLHGGYLGRVYDNNLLQTNYADDTEGQLCSDVYELDLAASIWRRLLPLPVVVSDNKPTEFELAKHALNATLEANGILEHHAKVEPVAISCPVKPVARFSHSMCVHEQKLYIFGGLSVPAQFSTDQHGVRNAPNGNSALDINIPKLHSDVHTFDLVSCVWERLTATGSAPAARQAHASDIYRRYGRPTRMIIHGGSTPHHMLNDIFSLDLKTFQWREMKRDTMAAQAAIMQLKNNDDSNTVTASVPVLAPCGKSRHRITIIGCKMFVMGGIRVKTHGELDADLHRSSMDDIDKMTRYVPVNELAVFDFEKRVWTISTPSTYARSRLPAIISPPSELVTTNAPAGGTAVSFAAGGDNAQVVVVTEPKKRQYSEANKWPLCEDFAHVPCIDLTQHNFRLYAICGPELDKHFFQADIGRPPAPPQLRYLSITYDNVEIEWNAVPNADEYLIQLQLLAIEDSSPLYHKVASSTAAPAHHSSPYNTVPAVTSQQRVVLPPAAGLFTHNMLSTNSSVSSPAKTVAGIESAPAEDKPSGLWTSASASGFSDVGNNNQLASAVRRTTPTAGGVSSLPISRHQQPHNLETNIPYYLRPKTDIELVDADSCIGLAMTPDNHMQSIDDSIAYAQLTTPTMPVASFNLPTRAASAWFDVAIVDRMSNTFVVDSYLVPDAQSRNVPPFTENVPDYRTGTVLTRVYGLYGIGTLSLTRLFQNLMVKLRVCAINGCGRSIFSNEVQIKTYLRGLPPPPENVQVKWTNDHGCSISWKEVTENGPIKDYTVFLMQKITNDSGTDAAGDGPTAVIVYEGSRTSAVIPNEQLARAYIETINGEPAITFRVSSRNEALLGGQAVQVRWLYRSPARGSPNTGGGGAVAPPWLNAGIGSGGAVASQLLPPPAPARPSSRKQQRSLLPPSANAAASPRSSHQLPSNHSPRLLASDQPIFPRTLVPTGGATTNAMPISISSSSATGLSQGGWNSAPVSQLSSSKSGSTGDFTNLQQQQAVRSPLVFAKRAPPASRNLLPAASTVTGPVFVRPTAVSLLPQHVFAQPSAIQVPKDTTSSEAAAGDKKKKTTLARPVAKNSGAPVGLDFSDLPPRS